MKKALLALVLTVPALSTVHAEKGVVMGETAVMTAVIHSINYNTHEISFKTDDGQVTPVFAGPEVKRFSELKVGDRVTFHYLAAVIAQLQTSDKPLSAPVETETTVRKTAGAPGAVHSKEKTAVVAVESVDAAHSSVTVKDFAGKTTSFRVEDKARLAGLKAGDHIQVSFTEAVAIDVEPAAPKPAAKPVDKETK